MSLSASFEIDLHWLSVDYLRWSLYLCECSPFNVSKSTENNVAELTSDPFPYWTTCSSRLKTHWKTPDDDFKIDSSSAFQTLISSKLTGYFLEICRVSFWQDPWHFVAEGESSECVETLVGRSAFLSEEQFLVGRGPYLGNSGSISLDSRDQLNMTTPLVWTSWTFPDLSRLRPSNGRITSSLIVVKTQK